MHIAALQTRNFKGLNIAVDFKPVTIVSGDNYQGKTAVLEAIRLALTGHLPPPIGKLAKNIYSLAGNNDKTGEMAILLITDNGRDLTWRWTKNAKGSVSSEGAAPADMFLPDLLMDPVGFFGMTKEQQLTTIFNAVPKVPLEREDVINSFETVEAKPFADCEKAKDEAAEMFVDLLKNHTMQEACTQFITSLKEAGKKAKDEFTRASGSFNALRLETGGRPTNRSEEISALREKLHGVAANPKGALLALTGKEQLEEAIQFIRDKEAELEKERKDYDAMSQPEDPSELSEEVQKLQAKVDSFGNRIAVFSSQKNVARQLIKQLTSLKSTACPTCGNTVKGWHETALHKAELALADIVKQEKPVKAKADTALKAYHDASKALAELTKKNKGIEGAQRTAIHRIDGLANMVKAGLQQVELLENTPDTSKERQRIAELEAEQRRFEAYEHNKAQRDKFEQAVLTHQARVETFKGIVEQITKLLAKTNDDMFKVLMGKANLFSNGILNSGLEFENGDLGRRVSKQDQEDGNTAELGSWISHTTFSGTEKLLTYAAFGVALSTQAPFKIVMMDELGRLTVDNKRALIERMNQLAKDGVIDQFIGVDVNDGDFEDICHIVRP